MYSHTQTTDLIKPNGGKCGWTYTIDPAAPWLTHQRASPTQILVAVQTTDLALSGTSQQVTVTVNPDIVDSVTLQPAPEYYQFMVSFVEGCEVTSMTLGPLADKDYTVFSGQEVLQDLNGLASIEPSTCPQTVQYSLAGINPPASVVFDSLQIVGD